LIQSTDAHTVRSLRLRSSVLLAMKRPIVRRIFLLADVVLGMSSGSVEYLRALDLGEDRVRRAAFVVENDWWLERASAVDRDGVRATWGVPPEASVVLSCAKLQHWKRPEDVLRAFARASVPNSYLVFAG